MDTCKIQSYANGSMTFTKWGLPILNTTSSYYMIFMWDSPNFTFTIMIYIIGSITYMKKNIIVGCGGSLQ